VVDRQAALFAAWYEFFPRSAEGRGDRGSTFRDCLPRVDDARRMGFDVIYFPPIHPIGHTTRKGRNNSITCDPGDPGVPWAIGSEAGGHKAVEPSLGTVRLATFVFMFVNGAIVFASGIGRLAGIAAVAAVLVASPVRRPRTQHA
jgi:hypothetical protein